jgi:hypothetical protein
MLNIFFLFFSFWFSNQSNADQGHKFYVSTTTIEFKMDTKSLQITSQLFTDDIESIVQNINEGLSLDPDSDQEVINQLISNYFKQTLKFTSEGCVIDYVFLGK